MEVLVAQWCPTLCDPMDCSPPGSSVHGILQARILEWVVISFSRGSSQPRDGTQVSCIAGRFFTIWATREALLVYIKVKKKNLRERILFQTGLACPNSNQTGTEQTAFRYRQVCIFHLGSVFIHPQAPSFLGLELAFLVYLVQVSFLGMHRASSFNLSCDPMTSARLLN